MPAIGGDTGALFGDDFVIHNGTGSSMNICVTTGVTLNVGGQSFLGSSSQAFTLTTLKTLSCYAVDTTTWFGLSS